MKESKQLSLAMELHLEAKNSHKPPVAMQKFKFNFLFFSLLPSDIQQQLVQPKLSQNDHHHFHLKAVCSRNQPHVPKSFQLQCFDQSCM
jgi:hypothetical protein